MPTPTYVALDKVVLTATQSSITFTAIDNSYTDLIILCSARATLSSVNLNIKLNGSFTTDSGTNITGDGSAAASSNTIGRSVAGGVTISSDTANTFASTELYFPNYAGSTYKVISATSARETNATAATIAATAFLYQQTSAISEIQLIPSSGSFVSGSRFDLYGIKNS